MVRAAAASKTGPHDLDEPDERDVDTTPGPTLDEIDEFARVMWYGDGGKGKTTDLCTLANRGRLVLIAADPGLKAKALTRRGVKIGNIEVIQPGEVSYRRLDELFWSLKERLEEEPGSVLGLGWDSMTETIRTLIKAEVRKGVAKAERLGKDRTEMDVYKEDYGVVTEQIRDLLRKYRDLPLHLGITALSRRDQDEEGLIRVGPGTTPAVQNDLIGYCDVIVHCRVEAFDDDVEFSGLTVPVGRFEAKDRYGMLPRNMVDPTFERILDYLDEALVAESDPLQVAARQRRSRKDGKS